MTNISTDDVQHLAQLSSLQLEDGEAEALRVDLENILGYIEQLSELNTEGVEPTYQVTDLQNVWRDDVVDDYGLGRDALLALAPDAEKNQIKVPKVL
jgi:aspartyl-tRNA(Asn)/glutamyl-tRNA(Gln) amidotransferase subunit C